MEGVDVGPSTGAEETGGLGEQEVRWWEGGCGEEEMK